MRGDSGGSCVAIRPRTAESAVLPVRAGASINPSEGHEAQRPDRAEPASITHPGLSTGVGSMAHRVRSPT